MRASLLVLIASAVSQPSWAQTVTDTSYVTSVGERVLRVECTVPAGIRETWKLFSTAEGLRKWAAPVVAIDLRVGGHILTNYDKTKSVRDPGTIRLLIVNYLEGDLMTLKVTLNDDFPAKIRRRDGNLQEIIQLHELGSRRTRITSSMLGWGVGPEWDRAYAFFAAGNKWTYQQLVASFQR
jgi:hypothetical protein